MSENLAVISFSFDDARKDSYRAIRIANDYGIKVTLNVTTGYVESRIHDSNDIPSHLPAMSKNECMDLFFSGNELAGHGNIHNNHIDNILLGCAELLEWENKTNCRKIGFASPRSQVDLSKETITVLCENNIEYIRIGPFINKTKLITKIFRKICDVTGNPFLYKTLYKSVVHQPIEASYIIKSIPIMKTTTLKQVEALVKSTEQNKGWCVLMFHSILDVGEEGFNEKFSWSLEDYKRLCEFLSKRENIKCMTTKDAFNEKVM